MRRAIDVSNAQAARQAGIKGLAGSPWGRPLISELLESIPDPVIGCDADGRVVYWSRAAREAYGYSSDEAVGQPVVRLLRTRFPAPLMEIMEEVTDLGRWQGRLTHRTRDGRDVAVESRWVARYDDAGRLVGGFGIERAVSSGPQADPATPAQADRGVRADGEPATPTETELRVAERLESLGQLAGGVAHDFNNALAIIVNYTAFVGAQLRRLRSAPTDAQRESLQRDLDEITAAADRAVELNHRLLAFARQDVAAPGPLGLNDVIDQLEPLLAQTVGEHVRVVLALADGLPLVRADLGEIQRILVNLAVNARDAMPAGGTLTIETSAVQLDAQTAGSVGDLAPGAYARLRISDTGHGMAREVVERAFDPFFTTKAAAHGTGLGLSSVRGVVTRAGGHVRVHSEPDVGTSFVALLPALDAPGDPAGERGADDDQAASPRTRAEATDAGTVLVVEDEHALREIVRRILARAGYDVLVAADGAEGLRVAAAHPGAIDLLLTDVVMPGLLGPQLAAQLQAQRPATAIAYMSGFADDVLGPIAVPEPAAVLDKPFTAQALLGHVRSALSQSDEPSRR